MAQEFDPAAAKTKLGELKRDAASIMSFFDAEVIAYLANEYPKSQKGYDDFMVGMRKYTSITRDRLDALYRNLR